MNTKNEIPMANMVYETLKSKDLDQITSKGPKYWHEHFKALVNGIPYLGGLAATELQVYLDYKDEEFFRKFVRFLTHLKDVPPEERDKFTEEVKEKSNDFPGNVIMGLVDRMDNINKEEAMARLVIARIQGQISIEDFFRLSVLLERIPYVDFEKLPEYAVPFYDESGDTELLYSTGALVQQTIDSMGDDKYILSKLGVLLLKWGFDVEVGCQQSSQTVVNLPLAGGEDIKSMMER